MVKKSTTYTCATAAARMTRARSLSASRIRADSLTNAYPHGAHQARRGGFHMPARRRTPAARAPRTRSSAGVPAGMLDKLEWRQAGPFRGGRVGDVAGDPRERNTFYFGSTGGGVWKSQDAGHYWENVSDGFFKRASVGAIAVANSDPNVAPPPPPPPPPPATASPPPPP